MRSIFSAILTILYIGYGITAFVFAWDAVSYFSGVHSFFGLPLIIYCFPSIGLVILSMISGGVGAISGWLSEKFHRF